MLKIIAQRAIIEAGRIKHRNRDIKGNLHSLYATPHACECFPFIFLFTDVSNYIVITNLKGFFFTQNHLILATLLSNIGAASQGLQLSYPSLQTQDGFVQVMV